MKKLMMLAALLAMVLVAAAPALAQDVTFEGDGDDNSQGDDATNQTTESLQYCIALFGDQNAAVAQNVSSDDSEAAIASDGGGGAAEGEEDQEEGNQTGAAISQEQAQYCDQVIQNALADDESASVNVNDAEIDGVDNDEDGAVDEGDGSEASAAAAAAAAVAASGSGSAAACAGAAAGGSGAAAGAGAAAGGSAGSTGVLPATGGASLLALGAGALLVAGGLVARRIVR